MYRLRQMVLVMGMNLRRWRKNPQIWLAFGLGFVICFLLSNKVLTFSQEHGTALQIFEPFIWTFGDATSILILSLCLLLLFADVPNVGNEVPFLLVRTSRLVWLMGQILYVIVATLLFVCFILISTMLLAGVQSYTANMWSNTAAILGYSNIGTQIAVPAFVKVMELTDPRRCALHIFGLMLGYSLLMSSLILYLNLWKGKAGMVGGMIFSGFGAVMNPQILSEWFQIPVERIRIANIIFGWISPLNHGTYYMHNFGYDNLPRLWVSYVFFGVGSLVLFALSLWKIRRYAFHFTGTKEEMN